MIQCPECRSMIPDDSAFCDQCGKELKWCPECKKPKRGTECPVCGSDLVPGRKYLSEAVPGGGGVSSPQPTTTSIQGPVALVGNGWQRPGSRPEVPGITIIIRGGTPSSSRSATDDGGGGRAGGAGGKRVEADASTGGIRPQLRHLAGAFHLPLCIWPSRLYRRSLRRMEDFRPGLDQRNFH